MTITFLHPLEINAEFRSKIKPLFGFSKRSLHFFDVSKIFQYFSIGKKKERREGNEE